jgi:hypothetical protein
MLSFLDAFTIHKTPIYKRIWIDKYSNQITTKFDYNQIL